MGTQLKGDGAVSSHMRYARRSGTQDSGRDYEFKMLTLIALRCAIQDSEDIWLATNADGVGDFDDIILCNNGSSYLVQLKHKENSAAITQTTFHSKKGDFSLCKYDRSFTELNNSIQANSTKSVVKYLNASSMLFILFTNKGTNNYEFLEPDTCSDYSLFSTSKDTTGNVYKFNLEKFQGLTNLDHCQNIRLFSNQTDVNRIDSLIRTEVEKVVSHYGLEKTNIQDVADKFTLYITNWAKGSLSGNYCLTKQQILFKISELFICQYELDLREECPFFNYTRATVWNKIIESKIITIVNFDNEVSKFLKQYICAEIKQYVEEFRETWDSELSNHTKQSFHETHAHLKRQICEMIGNIGKITLLDIYKCLWLQNKLPLLLQIKRVEDCENITRIMKMPHCSFRVIIVNKSSELLPNIGKTVGYFLNFHDLTDKERKKILNRHVKIQGRSSVLLSEVVDGSMYEHITTSDVIHILLNNFNIGKCFEPLPAYHIERRLWKIFIQPKILRKVKDDIFLIQNATNGSFDKVSVCKLEEFYLKRKANCNIIILNGNEKPKQIENLKNEGKAIHRLKFYEKQLLEWKESFGSVKNIRNYLLFEHSSYGKIDFNDRRWKSLLDNIFWVQLQDLLNDDEETYLMNTIRIITGSPGMGKSTILDSVALQVLPSTWILKVNLRDHVDYYDHMKPQTSNTAAFNHLKYFGDASIEKYPCTNYALAETVFKKLASNKQVLLLLDGFDEISVSYKDEVIQIVKCLRNEGYRLWLTTRPVMQYHLEEELNAISTTLKPFSDNDQRDFLVKYFTQNCIPGTSDFKTCIRAIKKFVKKLLTTIQTNFNNIDNQFTEIPLRTKLLAEVFQEDCENLVTTKNITFSMKFDLLHLYEEFINKKIRIFCGKFCECGKITCRVFKDYQQSYQAHQQLLALSMLFPKEDLLELNVDKQLEQYYTDQQNKTQLLQREGVVVAQQNFTNDRFSIIFIHRTVAEYLAALWLSQNCNTRTCKILIERRYEEEQYNFLFNIFDRMLAKNCPLHLHIINRQIEDAVKIVKSEPEKVSNVDSCGRSVLHLIALYGIFHPLHHAKLINRTAGCYFQDYMVNIIETIPGNVISQIKDDDFGHSPLYYAIASSSLAVANKICEKSENITIENYIHTSIKYNYFQICSVLQYKSLFTNLLMYFSFRDVLLNNVNKETTILSYCTPIDDEILDKIKTKSLSNVLHLNNLYYEDLRLAVAFGSEDNVLSLVSKGLEVNKEDINGNTPLHYAVIHEHLEVLKIILDNKAEIDKPGNDKNTALHFGAKTGNNNIILELLSRGAGINAININGEVPLNLALRSQHRDAAELLLSKGANCNVVDVQGRSMLHDAIFLGDVSVVLNVLSKGVDVNKLCELHETPLHWAVKYNHTSIVELLLSYGAKCNMNNIIEEHNSLKMEILNHSPLHLATIGNQVDIIKLLFSHSADCNLRDHMGKSPLHYAAEKGLTDIVSLFLTAVSDLNMQDLDGNTAFHLALKKGHESTANLLLAGDPDVTVENNKGISLLHLAVEKGCDTIVEGLLKRGVDVNKMSSGNSNSPLLTALCFGHMRCAKLLLSNGAMVNVENIHGVTPLHYAAARGDVDVLAQLLSESADINKRNKSGETPLHCAINDLVTHREASGIIPIGSSTTTTYFRPTGTSRKTMSVTPCSSSNFIITNSITTNLQRQKDIVHLLLDKGVDINAKDLYGYTALHHASRGIMEIPTFSPASQKEAEEFFEYTVSLFLSKGANVNLKNNEGKTCIDLATEIQYSKMVQLLNDSGKITQIVSTPRHTNKKRNKK